MKQTYLDLCFNKQNIQTIEDTVIAIVRKKYLCYDDCQDIVSAVLLRAFKNVSEVFTPVGNIREQYLKSIISSCFIDFIRRKNIYESKLISCGRDDAEIFENFPSRSKFTCLETNLDLIKFLQKYKNDSLILGLLNELSYSELAEEFNCTVGTISSKVQKKRAKLRKTMLEEGYGSIQ